MQLSSLPVIAGWIFASAVSLKSKFLIVRQKYTTYFMWILKKELEPAIIWKLVTFQRITSKRYSTSMGRHLSPRYGQVILVSGYSVLTAVNWSQHWCAIYVCNISLSVLPNWLESVRIKHWFPCGAADGRAGGVRSRDYQIFWDG